MLSGLLTLAVSHFQLPPNYLSFELIYSSFRSPADHPNLKLQSSLCSRLVVKYGFHSDYLNVREYRRFQNYILSSFRAFNRRLHRHDNLYWRRRGTHKNRHITRAPFNGHTNCPKTRVTI